MRRHILDDRRQFVSRHDTAERQSKNNADQEAFHNRFSLATIEQIATCRGWCFANSFYRKAALILALVATRTHPRKCEINSFKPPANGRPGMKEIAIRSFAFS